MNSIDFRYVKQKNYNVHQYLFFGFVYHGHKRLDQGEYTAAFTGSATSTSTVRYKVELRVANSYFGTRTLNPKGTDTATFYPVTPSNKVLDFYLTNGGGTTLVSDRRYETY